MRTESKRAQALSSLHHALHRNFDGIEELSRAGKHNGIAEKFLDGEEQKAVYDLFRLPGTTSNLLNRYLRVAQHEALQKLGKTCSLVEEGIVADDDAV